MHYAARSGSVGCLRALRRAGADMAARTKFGWTAAHVAANHSQPAALAALLRCGCPSEAGDFVGWTPLHLATLRLGEGTNGCECRRCTKLQERRVQCVRQLLRAGASTAARDSRGATPGHLAAAQDDGEALRLLRTVSRTDLWLPDDDGIRPLDIARGRRSSSSFVKALLMLTDSLQPQPLALGGIEHA